VIILIDWDATAWDRDSRAFSAGPSVDAKRRVREESRAVRPINEIALDSTIQRSAGFSKGRLASSSSSVFSCVSRFGLLRLEES